MDKVSFHSGPAVSDVFFLVSCFDLPVASHRPPHDLRTTHFFPVVMFGKLTASLHSIPSIPFITSQILVPAIRSYQVVLWA